MSEKHSPKQKKTCQDTLDGRANNQPPEHTRFQPGRSGNPKGRPKGRIGRVALLRRILEERVEIREGDRVRKMSKFEAMHYTMVHKALKGDAKAFKVLRDIVEDDPSLLEPVPLVNFIFTDKTPEEQREWEEWRAARNKSESDPPDK